MPIRVPTKESNKMKTNAIYIDHTEFEKGTYRSVGVLTAGIQKEFSSGDPVKDFADAVKFCVDNGYPTHYLSSVDDFVMDEDGYAYDENDMLIRCLTD